MKFNIDSKKLYTTVSAVSKVINSKNALTVLNNFYFRLSEGTLEVTGSDVENALTAVIPVTSVEGEGEFCLDARRMVELLKEIPSQPITFDINDDTLETIITYSGDRYSMVAVPGDQYPVYKKEESSEEPVVFSCPASQVITGISKTAFAVSTDDFHPQMTGILLEASPERMTFVATDTRQLVLYKDETSAPGVTVKAIVPLKPAKVIQDVFSGSETLTLSMTSKSATVTADNFTFNCRFIKGNYPPYERVIPQNNPYHMVVDRGRLLNAVRRVSIFVDPGYGMIKFKITNDKIIMKSVDPNLCTLGQAEIDCQYDGPELVIGFSAPYMTNILQNMGSQQVLADLSDPSRAGVFRPDEQPEHTSLLMLLMPMNVAEF